MDELEKLRAALRDAPPPTDPAARTAALARAMESFDRHQGSAQTPRPMSDRPRRAGFLTGVRQMLTRLSTRPALAATASVAALCVGLIVLQPGLLRQPDSLGAPPAPTPVTAAPPAKPAAPPAPTTQDARVRTGGAPTDAAADTFAGSTAKAASAEAETPEADSLSRMAASPPADPLEATVQYQAATAPPPDTEAFANEPANPVKITAEEPVSTFSIDVDTASYPVIRSRLTAGALPPPDAVRIEEMVNYFPYSYPAPEADDAPFRTSVNLFQTPWNKDTQLLRVGLQGRLPTVAERPPLDLVFLIDTSGSMDEPDKLPLLIRSFRLMLGELRPEDRVAIVTYAGSAGLVLEPTEAKDRAKIEGALDHLMAGGSTAGAEGLELAYQTAEGMQGDGRVRRILLATDGDFNVGVSDPEGLEVYVAKKRDSGTYLSVLGFGRGNLDDATMQSLAQNGNGTAAYIDTLSEAQKVLVDQLTGALFPIADDVKIQIEFNPAAVAEYRLIGYETRALAREDFNNDKVDAGDIGVGHQMTALYEIVPVGSPARLSDPLRYGEAAVAPKGDASELGYLKLRYKKPGNERSELVEQALPSAPVEADEDSRFVAAIAGFGQLLTGGKYLGAWGWQDTITLAAGARGADPYGYRGEAVQLMRLAESLSK